MRQQLRTIPCITKIQENYRALWELCLTNIWCPTTVTEWRERIDSTKQIEYDQTLFVNFSASEIEELTQVFGFPVVELPLLPSIAQVNEVLPIHFENNNLLKQTSVSTEITERIIQELPQVVILLVFDGLSFYEVVDWDLPNARLEPCLVNGLSTTEEAMPRLIGDPVLTHQLFPLGYNVRLGFSYWERSSNSLTNILFAEFPQNQLHRVTTFDEVLDTINSMKWQSHTYIQIIRAGLDHVCHTHKERPNVNRLLDDLNQDIKKLIKVLQETDKTFRLFITADHGILWHNEQDIVPLAQEKYKARYTKGIVPDGDDILTLNTDEGIYTVLTGDKVIAKNKKSTEWGFHGGVSAQESLVPFWDVHN